MFNSKKISNFKPIILDETNSYYEVVQGTANLYIAEFKDSVIQYRMFLKKLHAKDFVPGFNEIDDNKNYRFFIVNDCTQDDDSIDELHIQQIKSDKTYLEQFIFNLPFQVNEKNYKEEIIKNYLVSKASDNIKNLEMHESNVNKTNKTIYNIRKAFDVRHGIDYNIYDSSNAMYFALSMVASSVGIDYVKAQNLSYDQIQTIDVDTFSELSGCISRKFKLEFEWYKLNFGSFVAFLKDNNRPVPVIYKGNRYYYYPDKHSLPIPITKKNYGIFNIDAYLFYRSFPDKGLNILGLCKFCIKSCSRLNIVLFFFLAVIATVLGLLIPYANQTILNNYIPAESIRGLLGFSVVVFVSVIATFLFSLIKKFSLQYILTKTKYDLQIALFDRVFKLKQSFINKYDTSELSLDILVGVERFMDFMSDFILAIVGFILSFIFISQMGLFAPSLLPIAIILIFLSVAVQIVVSLCLIKKQDELTEVSMGKSSFLFQIIRGIKKIRLSGAEERVMDSYMKEHIKYATHNYLIGSTFSYQSLLSVLSSTLFLIFIFAYIFISNNDISVGSLVAFISAFSLVMVNLSQGVVCFNKYTYIHWYIKAFKKLLKEPIESYGNFTIPDKIQGNIEVNHVSFSYGDDRKQILDDLSISIKEGEYVGIVGHSGCGKTTLLNLLIGNLKPKKGNIFYGNVNLNDIDKQKFRSKVGVVLQDGGIIAGSILDNVRFTCPEAELSDVEEALKIVGLYDDIKAMPMGVHTYLSEGSGLVSGGQKQRILVARAIMNNPAILFLDEATSSLDNVSQKYLTNELDNLKCTRFVIAHRLSTVINCDKIFVLDNGSIAEFGTYDELIEKNGLFAEMAKRQLL